MQIGQNSSECSIHSFALNCCECKVRCKWYERMEIEKVIVNKRYENRNNLLFKCLLIFIMI